MMDRIKLSIAVIVFVLIGIVGFIFMEVTDKKTNVTPTSKLDTTHVESTVQEPVTVEQPKPRIWKGSDYGLPVGVVVGGEMDNENPTLNWLSIQQPDGHMVLVKSIDGPLWVAIQKGDIIE